MKRNVWLRMGTLVLLAGCPSTTPAPSTVTTQRAGRCPDENCNPYNGPRMTGADRHDAPSPVTAVRTPSGTTVEVKP